KMERVRTFWIQELVAELGDVLAAQVPGVLDSLLASAPQVLQVVPEVLRKLERVCVALLEAGLVLHGAPDEFLAETAVARDVRHLKQQRRGRFRVAVHVVELLVAEAVEVHRPAQVLHGGIRRYAAGRGYPAN